MNVKNYVNFEILSLPENVSFARSSVGAFVSQIDCTLEDVDEIKLVVSEAVSNSIIHGYNNQKNGKIFISVIIYDNRTVEIIIEDNGIGIEDIEKALEPAYSSDPQRMGLGFTFMQSFMDDFEVLSKPNEGTSIRLKRNFLAKGKEAYA
ncbi:Anti-sigma F factor [Candidatus Syntrophocurvum alkaliphilum]|uniref:Anti-sigma F factor n=1 Tax=Candidatus Syntrophocurvum alkaliphilum TaxID=2293317 RepID=A0A6I6DCF2_9FIRM|nr:anti-sigma F factor [Candidatus Syntrophocurvum alkaliphilum]QGT98995.1 Anti-sigma F factor [Candidatus Syntrophocurvum alkaliphilum]